MQIKTMSWVGFARMTTGRVARLRLIMSVVDLGDGLVGIA